MSYHLIVDFERDAINAFKSLSSPSYAKCMEKSPRIRSEKEISGGSIICVQIRMLPALAFATPTDIPEFFNQLVMELPTEAYD